MIKTISAYQETGPSFWNLNLEASKGDKELANSHDHMNEEKDSNHLK